MFQVLINCIVLYAIFKGRLLFKGVRTHYLNVRKLSFSSKAALFTSSQFLPLEWTISWSLFTSYIWYHQSTRRCVNWNRRKIKHFIADMVVRGWNGCCACCIVLLRFYVLLVLHYTIAYSDLDHKVTWPRDKEMEILYKMVTIRRSSESTFCYKKIVMKVIDKWFW